MRTPTLYVALLLLVSSVWSQDEEWIDIAYDGTVYDATTGKGLRGVKVTLPVLGLSATTDQSGSWLLMDTRLGVAPRIAGRTSSRHLTLQAGHLRLRFEGRDIRGSRRWSQGRIPSASSAARAAAAVVDTILYSWKDTVRLRVPVEEYVLSGLTATLDTSSYFEEPVCAKLKATFYTGTSGSITDSRDGQRYDYVKIGTQYWLTRNLNYAGPTDTTIGLCPGPSGSALPTSGPGVLANCTTYGRLYDWARIMQIDTAYNTKLYSRAGTCKRQGICPSGWHVPTDSEWIALFAFVGSDSARVRLSSKTGWDYCYSGCSYPPGNGTDIYRFSALPAGLANDYHNANVYYRTFVDRGLCGVFASSKEIPAGHSSNGVVFDGGLVGPSGLLPDHSKATPKDWIGSSVKWNGISVRCIANQ